MQLYDIIMLVVMASAILFGLWKGLAWQIASIAAIVVSYFVALTFRAPVAAMIKTEEPWNRFLAMFILFIGTSLVIWIAFGFISRTIEKMQLKDFDRHAGAVVGALKGAVLCLVITFFAMTLLSAKQKEAICDSYSGRYMATAIDKIQVFMPKEVHTVIHPYLEKLDNELEKDHSLVEDNNPAESAKKAIFDTIATQAGFGKKDGNSTKSNPNLPGILGGGPKQANTIGDFVNESPAGDFIRDVPIDPTKIDWRKIDWNRAAEAIGNQVNQSQNR